MREARGKIVASRVPSCRAAINSTRAHEQHAPFVGTTKASHDWLV